MRLSSTCWIQGSTITNMQSLWQGNIDRGKIEAPLQYEPYPAMKRKEKGRKENYEGCNKKRNLAKLEQLSKN